jgi:hypothetical protein
LAISRLFGAPSEPSGFFSRCPARILEKLGKAMRDSFLHLVSEKTVKVDGGYDGGKYIKKSK